MERKTDPEIRKESEKEKERERREREGAKKLALFPSFDWRQKSRLEANF